MKTRILANPKLLLVRKRQPAVHARVLTVMENKPGKMRYARLVCPSACALSAFLLWKRSRALQAKNVAERLSHP